MKAFLEFLINLFKPTRPSLPGGTVTPIPEDNFTEPARIITSHVLLINIDPIVDPATKTKLTQKMGWRRVDAMANEFISDILTLSGGLARYQIVQRIEVTEFPVLADGFRYDTASYLNVHKRAAVPHEPNNANYQVLLNAYNIPARIASRDIDEVWIFNFPYGGFYESAMGGAGAFWCNAKPLEDTSGCKRKFVVMGFSYERGIGEMLESFGHRAESLLGKVYNCQDFISWAYLPNRIPATAGMELNPFQRYLCFEQMAPGRAGIGSIHFAPNSVLDYEWDNPRQVQSNCDDWFNFPNFRNTMRLVGPDEWGGELRSHHEWWFRHLPKTAGRSKGIANNWWQYVMDPNLIIG